MTTNPRDPVTPLVDVDARILVLRGRKSFFVFQLSAEELSALRSQIVTSNVGHGGRRYLPMAFSEHGALMAASVLNSPRAIEMSVFLVRAFIRLRDAARTNTEIGKHLALLERRVTAHDVALKGMFSTIRALIEPPRAAKKQIGFRLAR